MAMESSDQSGDTSQSGATEPKLTVPKMESGWAMNSAFKAAYDAALESLKAQRSTVPMQQKGQFPRSNQDLRRPPPYSFAPSLVSLPQLYPGPPFSSPSDSDCTQPSQARSSIPGQSSGNHGQNWPRPLLSPLVAPTLTYLPVGMENLGANAQANQQAQLPFPHPVAAPAVPVMIPFGFSAGLQLPTSQAAAPLANPLPVPQTQFPPHPHAQPPDQPQPPPQAQPHLPAGPEQRGAGGLRMQFEARLGAGGMPAHVQRNVRVIRINLRIVLQVLLVAVLIWQSSPRGAATQWIALAFAAYFLWPYLNQNNAVIRWIRTFLQGAPGNPRQGLGEARENTEPRPAEQDRGARPARRRGVLNEACILFVGFIASLLPGFDMNADDAAALAAAQRNVDQEPAN